MFEIYRRALADLGFEIFDVPVDAFLVPDATRIAGLLANLKSFRPALAFGLPKGSYALLCRLPARRDGWRPNLFTDVLEIPTICLWDHAPLESADQLLTHPADPAESASGALEALRQTLTHPRLIHWSPDTGQTQIMTELGLLLPNRVIQESLPSLPGFVPQATRPNLGESGTPSVGFVGHFYQEPPAYPRIELRNLADGVIQEWLPDSGRPLWRLLGEHLDSMDRDTRKQLGLDRDQTYFWHFAHRLIIHQAQTALRLEVVGSAGVPVACYGNLKMDVRGVPRNLTPIPGNIPFGPELAAALARHTITIDVFNPGSIHGYSHKPMMAFAAGGFMLVNRRRDFIQAFGEAGEAVSYGQDLAAKIDRFLTNPKYLREVGETIRETISAQFQLRDVLTRVLQAAFRCDAARSTPAPTPDPPAQIVTAENLSGNIRSKRAWFGRNVQRKDGAILIVAPEQWAHAAVIKIPRSVRAMREPHLRLSLVVEAGTIGVAAMQDKTKSLLEEQLASTSQDPTIITIELPHEGVSKVILRNTADTASRAQILEASLRDRVTGPS